ncbi:MAG: putative sulfate exporter family transporter [Bdellovibrionales bacterium]|nr:putative sulfate exporter family transporter [Bdellovibrionales bacterium]
MKFNLSIIPIVGFLCLFFSPSSAVALILGVIITLIFGNPHIDRTRKLTSTLLSLSVMGLGAGMNLNTVGTVGLQGFLYTVVGITSTLVLGTLLGKIFKTEKETSTLIAVGTAICGGSAIAAMAPTIQAKHHNVSVSLGVVFLLNALALVIFPTVGHHFELSEQQFGLWSALAIHDTSSVVGATLQYGSKALEIGTTVKLARALWIVPVTIAYGFLIQKNPKSDNKAKAKRPWFILGFLVAAALVTWIPSLQSIGISINHIARKTLVVTLFLIGTNLTRETLKNVGAKPLIQGICLWILVAGGTLSGILLGWIK